MNGSKLLKAMGVLMILAGIAVTALGVIAMFVEGLFSAAGASIPVEWAIAVLGLLAGIVEFFAGVSGVKNWNKPHKATKCVVLGIIVLALIIPSQALSFMQSLVLNPASVFTWANVAAWIAGFIVPVLYLFGAAHLSEQSKG